MIKVYSKNNCPNCDKIKRLLERNNIAFEYIKDDALLSEIAGNLHKNGKLKETIAPLVIDENGEQIKHKNLQLL